MKTLSQGSRQTTISDIPYSPSFNPKIRNGVNWRNKTIYSVLFCHWFLWQQKLKLVTKLNCDIEFKSHLIKWQKSDMDIRKITKILSHKWEISSQIWELWTYDNPATTIPQPITIRQHTFHGSKAIYSTITTHEWHPSTSPPSTSTNLVPISHLPQIWWLLSTSTSYYSNSIHFHPLYTLVNISHSK